MPKSTSTAAAPLIAGELGFLVSGVRNAIWSAIERELQSLDITTAQYIVFNSIAQGRGRTISDLCRVLGYDSGAMTRLLDRVEGKGLVRRVANPDDRRSYLLELTPESSTLYPQARRRVEAVFKHLLAGFDEAQAAALKAALEKVLANAARSA